ncbi:MAG: DNA repair protein RecN [Bdellovibrionales bacterium]|nr:DNA repair protein RecN [Bdellovibrionales bacterium]
MLLELKISKFAVIDHLHLNFKTGLNILRGETGSGKSVLLKSLALLMGDKASADTIRTGHSQAVVEGSFDLSHRSDIRERLLALGIEPEEDMLIVRRLISQGDKSRVYLNGNLSTLQSLRDIVAPLIEVTGHQAPLIEMTTQHENRHLLSKGYHMDLLDQHAHLWERRIQFESEYQNYADLKSQLDNLKANTKNSAQRLDYLTYQFEEISKLHLTAGEDLDLEIEVKKLKNASRLNQFVETAELALDSDDDSAINRLNAVLKKSLEVSSLDPRISEKVQSLEQAKVIIEDSLYDLRNYVEKIDSEPARLESLEARLSDFRKLQKKYGLGIDEILEAQTKMKFEIDSLLGAENQIESIQKEISKKELVLKKQATDLHSGRQKGAVSLSKKVNAELEDLNMKGVTFHIEIRPLAELTLHGLSDIEFMSQTSPKDPVRPLARFASGGELSRILLALKKVVGHSNQPRTYLFDEVDSGVSGTTAEKVGRKLKAIAQGQQVICVTHLPQVAAYGDCHFQIQKSQTKEGVSTEVKELSSKDRVLEIARLISGEKLTKTSLAHAEELITQAQDF